MTACWRSASPCGSPAAAVLVPALGLRAIGGPVLFTGAAWCWL
ncbi:MAG: hypothetical protein WDN69_27235 [Aliidongia sp.]